MKGGLGCQGHRTEWRVLILRYRVAMPLFVIYQIVFCNASYITGSVLGDWQYIGKENQLPALTELTF